MPYVDLNELYDPQALCELSHSEMVLMPLPESPAARIIRMMTDAMPLEEALQVVIGDLRLQSPPVQRRIAPIDAGCARALLDLEHGLYLASTKILNRRIDQSPVSAALKPRKRLLPSVSRLTYHGEIALAFNFPAKLGRLAAKLSCCVFDRNEVHLAFFRSSYDGIFDGT